MATSDANPVFDFLGRRSNLIGVSAAVLTMAGTAVAAPTMPLIALGVGVISYASGFLLGGGNTGNVDLHITTGNEKVEVATIQRNITALETTLAPHRKRLPEDILQRTDEVLGTLKEILPQWGKLSSFADQKYTVNAILTDYLPQTIQNYLNLPTSYYRNAQKKQVATEVQEQLDILFTAVNSIRDSVYEGIEGDIKKQTLFLKNKFTANADNSLDLTRKASA